MNTEDKFFIAGNKIINQEEKNVKHKQFSK